MSQAATRRTFLASAAAAGAATWFAIRHGQAAEAQQRLAVGVMGMGGRGTQLATLFGRLPNVAVAWVCDVDSRRAAQAAEAVGKATGQPPPQAVQDFRRILDDKAVDALVIATCNHWHAPAAILGCQAGKHAYVEKPCSHTPLEGELMVAAARKHKRCVQMGNQRRSMPAAIEAVEQLRAGIIGRIYYAQAWYFNTRPSIGVGKPAPVPQGLDCELWQGPAPRRPFKTNILHYNWHWFWHWGNGELGNNGVHSIDTCRWGLAAHYPVLAASVGGRFRYSEIEEGHKSTLLCHLGNITYRVGRSLACDPANGHILGDAEAAKLWSRDYEPGWEPGSIPR